MSPTQKENVVANARLEPQNLELRKLRYPRRRFARLLLRQLAKIAFFFVARLTIKGVENIPNSGRVILVANHFHFADPVALLVAANRQVEFVGGFRFPNAPAIVKFLPSLWGYFPVFRGAYSRNGLEAAKHVLAQDGILAIFPEGGAWADVLRPARPGAAYLSVETGAVIVPVALSGFTNLFKIWRPQIEIQIGKPIGPFESMESGKKRRHELDEIGEEIMRSIAALLPAHSRGVFSDDGHLREAAAKVSSFPFEQDDMRGM